jgi:Zn-dependent protease
VLYALGDPFSLLVLVVAFLVATTLAGLVSSLAASRAGDRTPAAEGRLRPDPRRHVDPFGAVAALLSGVGWAKPVAVPYRASRGATLRITLLGPLVCLLVAAACLVGFGVLGGGVLGATVDLVRDGIPAGSGLSYAERALLLFGLVHLFVGLVSLVPLPPLDGGRLLFARAPQSEGWQKAELYLVEKNLGLLAVLLLLLLPLGGPRPLLQELLNVVGQPIVRLLTGA